MSSVTYPQSKARADAASARVAASRSLTLKASHTAIWLAVCAIAKSFAALTSALIVRQGTGMDWKPFVLPPILYLNTVLLLTSSFTLEFRAQTDRRCGCEQPIRNAPARTWQEVALRDSRARTAVCPWSDSCMAQSGGTRTVPCDQPEPARSFMSSRHCTACTFLVACWDYSTRIAG